MSTFLDLSFVGSHFVVSVDLFMMVIHNSLLFLRATFNFNLNILDVNISLSDVYCLEHNCSSKSKSETQSSIKWLISSFLAVLVTLKRQVEVFRNEAIQIVSLI